MTFKIVPCSPVGGAEIRGLDLRQKLDPATVSELNDVWHENLVLLFCGADFSDEQLVEFSRNFGEPELSPPNEAKNTKSEGYIPDLPEVAVISNVIVNGVEIGSLGAGECSWHADMSYNPQPVKAAALYALELPAAGGETSFLNLYAAYEAMPDALKKKISGHRAIHDLSHTSAGTLRKGYEQVTDVTKTPGAHHPMAIKHPTTGRTALLLGRRSNSYIVGLSVEESEALLDEVWAHATQPLFVWTHNWRVGDVIIWDNFAVMHRRLEFDADDRRIMHRTQLKGVAPVAA